ncbi:tetratricopeptide repeat protein [Methylorubrum populi]|uniref:tetratricopeptide repeat protein n=1 Tax=Methylorubrum TaxID=2282523 RepID=UPI001153EA22|nr:tetratricopeptide repeat protein [Methylorubrum populi]QDI82069.1 tetratricopeptide repeat protein [Methylorubrum populi]
MLEHRTTRTLGQAAGKVSAAEPVDRYLAKAATHRAAGRFDKARRNLRMALDAVPGHAAAHFELGLLTNRTEAPAAAVPHFVEALRAAPERPAYWLALATTLLTLNRVGEARALMERFRDKGLPDDETRRVLKDFVEQAFTLGQAHYEANDLTTAEILLDLVIGLDDTHAKATHLAGAAAARRGHHQQAYDLFSIAIYREPDNAAFFSSLGALLIILGDNSGAIAALEKAVTLDPDLAIAHSNLSGAFQRVSHHASAVSHAQRSIALNPNFSGAHINLGCGLKSLGRLPEAIASFDRALALDPRNVAAHSNRLFAKLYSEGVSPEDYAADARSFGTRLAEPLLRRRPFTNDRDSDRRLRVGFVSADLCTHAVARFIEPFLRHIDRERFETRAYMTQAGEDAVSARLRPLFDGWHNIAALDDDAAADLIEADAIDILVDLSGHSAGHRLLVFARKPAPVQVTWIGHPATTGLRAMDYRLTDFGHDEPGLSDTLHTETLWRLPGVSATYEAPGDIPSVRARAPLEENGFVTFGTMNRIEKIGDRALEAWAAILRALPDARLFMVAADVDRPEIRARIEARLARAGLPLDRVRLHPRVNSGYYALYHEIDIALDSFPYNGGTTSCDTLAMGVPLIALAGTHAAARTGVAALTAVGLTDLIGTTPEDYAARAVALASDPDRLRALRSGLRERVFASPLMDHARFATEVGDAFRAMWRRWADANRAA